MDWLLYVVAAMFLLLGAVCIVLVIFQLPGVWIMLALAGIIEYCDRFYLPLDDQQTFGWWVLGACVLLAVIGEIVEFVAGALGAKKGGSSRRGMIGALIGGIVGVFVFMPMLFFIPFFGPLVGAVLGTFIGAVVGELSAERSTITGSIKPAIGATIGRVIGTMSKLGLAMAVWLVLTVAAFWP